MRKIADKMESPISTDEAIIFALNPTTLSIDVRFRDTDAMGHINNAVYHTYIEECRLRFMRGLSLPGYSVGDRPPIILARTEIDYLQPGFLGDKILVSGWIAEVGNKSFTMTFRIDAVERTCLATATSVQVWFDYAANHSVPIPHEARTLFQRLLAANQQNGGA